MIYLSNNNLLAKVVPKGISKGYVSQGNTLKQIHSDGEIFSYKNLHGFSWMVPSSSQKSTRIWGNEWDDTIKLSLDNRNWKENGYYLTGTNPVKLYKLGDWISPEWVSGGKLSFYLNITMPVGREINIPFKWGDLAHGISLPTIYDTFWLYHSKKENDDCVFTYETRSFSGFSLYGISDPNIKIILKRICYKV